MYGLKNQKSIDVTVYAEILNATEMSGHFDGLFCITKAISFELPGIAVIILLFY